MSFAWLDDAKRNDTSQYGEDGVIDAIFGRIWPENRWCFECGASDGLFFSNTRRLIKQGWNAILAEADHDAYRRLLANSAGFDGRVKTICETVDALDPVLAHFGAPVDIDLVVIDVDGQDYHLFNSLLRFRPRVVMIEFDHNADDMFIPDRGGEGQAGAYAIARLAKGRLYTEVWRSWCNMILVREPLHTMLDIEP